jgi:hypothetical protein
MLLLLADAMEKTRPSCVGRNGMANKEILVFYGQFRINGAISGARGSNELSTLGGDNFAFLGIHWLAVLSRRNSGKR